MEKIKLKLLDTLSCSACLDKCCCCKCEFFCRNEWYWLLSCDLSELLFCLLKQRQHGEVLTADEASDNESVPCWSMTGDSNLIGMWLLSAVEWLVVDRLRFFILFESAVDWVELQPQLCRLIDAVCCSFFCLILNRGGVETWDFLLEKI